MASVLVTDGNERSALAAVRSLGRAGHAVYVVSPRAPSLAGASRWASAEATVADSLRSPAAFLDDVATLVRAWQAELLLPISDASLLAVLPERNRFPNACVPFGPYEVFRRICDKRAVVEAARSVGLNIPAQHVLSGPDERTHLDLDGLRFPMVVKPARTVIEVDGWRAKTAVTQVCEPAALADALERVPAEAYPLLLQERVIGPGVGIFLLRWDGELLAVFSHRRIREKPPSGGVSVYRESIEADPDLVRRSCALLDRFSWQGVAMVEFKVDLNTGRAYVMEINARFWGSLQLAIDSGVDFPALLIAAACGARPVPVHTYRTGVRSRWFWGDVDHLVARLRHSDRRLGLTHGAPGRGRALLQFLGGFHRRSQSEILRWNDPQPFVRETIEWFRATRQSR